MRAEKRGSALRRATRAVHSASPSLIPPTTPSQHELTQRGVAPPTLWRSIFGLLSSLLELLPSGEPLLLQHRAGAAHLDVLSPGTAEVAEAATVRVPAPALKQLGLHFPAYGHQVGLDAAQGTGLR